MRRSPQAGPDAGGAGPAASPQVADAAAADAAVAADSSPGEGVPVPEPDDADVTPDHMEEAVRAAAEASEAGHLGEPGKPLNRRSPFFIGLAATAGVAVTIGLIEILIHARSVLILVGLALFVAAGLDPAVTWLTRHGMRRWLAVITVVFLVLAVIAGFLAAAIPPLAQQTTALADQLPHYAKQLQDHSSELGKLNARYHLEQRLEKLVSTRGTTLLSGIVGAGMIVIGAVGSLLVVVVLTIYFLAGLPRIKLFAYRLAPQSRRSRVILLGDEIFTKVGAYVLGNVVTSVIAGIGTFAWMLIFGIPYPVLLGLFVALLDLIPVIGSTIGGIVVTLVALTVSLPVALFTIAFYVGYRLAEDYLLVPRILGRAVQVPAVVSVVAVLVGGALLGIIGALVAIPAAAALRLWLDEVAFRRLDNT
ncbi:MAG TPA: AI-2E family transporter [Streptosporangiaceae bacterium]|jgi:predicted PurR-regulated permease PerM